METEGLDHHLPHHEDRAAGPPPAAMREACLDAGTTQRERTTVFISYLEGKPCWCWGNRGGAQVGLFGFFTLAMVYVAQNRVWSVTNTRQGGSSS